MIQYLDLYEKKQAEGVAGVNTRVSSQVLLRQKRQLDAKAAHPELIEVARNEEIRLADLLADYGGLPGAWPRAQVDRLRVHSTGGIRLGRLDLIWGGSVKEHLGFDRNDPSIQWQLTEVREDETCVYLGIRSGNDHDRRERWIGLSPERSAQVRAHLALEPFYLVAAESDSKESILKEHAKLRARLAAKEGAFTVSPGFAIWMSRTPSDKELYRLVVTQSDRWIRADSSFSKLESLLDTDLSIVSSDRFLLFVPMPTTSD